MAIRRIEASIPVASHELVETEIHDFVSSFNKKDRKRVEKLLVTLKRAGIQIDELGSVLYKDGSTGSSIYDLVTYFTERGGGAKEDGRPIDADRFLLYMKSIGIDILLITPSKRKLPAVKAREPLEPWKNIY